MTNREKYDNAFISLFDIKESDLNDDLKYSSISLWDSIGHMQLVAELETIFNIMMETEDILDLSSYKKGMEILSKYGVSF